MTTKQTFIEIYLFCLSQPIFSEIQIKPYFNIFLLIFLRILFFFLLVLLMCRCLSSVPLKPEPASLVPKMTLQFMNPQNKMSFTLFCSICLHFHCESLNEPLHLRRGSYFHEQIDLSHTPHTCHLSGLRSSPSNNVACLLTFA